MAVTTVDSISTVQVLFSASCKTGAATGRCKHHPSNHFIYCPRLYLPAAGNCHNCLGKTALPSNLSNARCTHHHRLVVGAGDVETVRHSSGGPKYNTRLCIALGHQLTGRQRPGATQGWGAELCCLMTKSCKCHLLPGRSPARNSDCTPDTLKAMT